MKDEKLNELAQKVVKYILEHPDEFELVERKVLRNGKVIVEHYKRKKKVR